MDRSRTQAEVDEPLCACGRPLHYTDPNVKATVEALVAELGPTVPIQVTGQQPIAVPRHYIALHGIAAAELPALAERYGWATGGSS